MMNKHAKVGLAISMRRNAGFNMAEVVISTIIVALMMTWLFNYVEIAGTVWRKSHATVNLTNDANALLDTLERELWHATECSMPQIGDTGSELHYAKVVSDYQAVASTTILDFRVYFDNTTHTVYTKVATDTVRWTTADTTMGWDIDTASGVKNLVIDQHNYDLARNVMSFSVHRKANRLLVVQAKLGITRDDGSDRVIEVSRSIMIR